MSRLEAEWRSLATRPEALAAARRWAVLAGAELHTSAGQPPGLPHVLGSLDEVLVAIGYRPRTRDGVAHPQVRAHSTRAGATTPAATAAPAANVGFGDAGGRAVGSSAEPQDATDRALLWLVTVARSDDLAARVVLQRLLPGLSAIARRHGRCMEEHLQAFDELLSAAWGVIRQFPVERRRRHVAASLLRDCEHQAFRRERRRLMVHELTETHRLDRAVEPDETQLEPLLEVLSVIGEARIQHLTDGDVELLGVLLGGGLLRDVAAELSVSVRTIRNHRDALIHRLRASVAA